MRNEILKQSDLVKLRYCVHCKTLSYDKPICPLCEQTLTQNQQHALTIYYLAMEPYIQEYVLTVKEPLNEFIIIRGGDVEIFKRQVLSLENWNQMVEHLISGYPEVGVTLTELFAKKDKFNKKIVGLNNEMAKYLQTIIKNQLPKYHLGYHATKDFVSITDIQKFIWRLILLKNDVPPIEFQVIEDPDKQKKWVILTDQSKVFNIIRIYSGRKITDEQIHALVKFFKPTNKISKKNYQALLNDIQSQFWNYLTTLQELFVKLQKELVLVSNEIRGKMVIQGECEICKHYPENDETKSNK